MNMNRPVSHDVEIRSRKVRNIIGQIPNRLIRYGSSVLLFVMLILFMGVGFYRYNPSFSLNATLFSRNNTIFFKLEVPVNNYKRFKKAEKIILHIAEQEFQVFADSVSFKQTIITDRAFKFVYGAIHTKNIEIKDTALVKATVLLPKTTLLSQVLN